MNWWESMVVNMVAGILHGAVKNPATFKSVENVIVKIRDDAATIALALDPAVPPPPGWTGTPRCKPG